jgi:hypothetical protein
VSLQESSCSRVASETLHPACGSVGVCQQAVEDSLDARTAPALAWGCTGYHPAQSQGHIKAVRMARAVQKTIHSQRFCLGVMEVASLTIRGAFWLASRGLH